MYIFFAGNGGKATAWTTSIGQETIERPILSATTSNVGPSRKRAGTLETNDGSKRRRTDQKSNSGEKSSSEKNSPGNEGQRNDV